ncbi:MAG: Gfo/Idh/MocA family oxidoreductase [Saprospiraceae bacterium]|uniref:Gfo/Idh/MocA family oxidoreductase n=1 Tax=Candidatus Opimibacter skivensis TaxID=2982028 RepID=A0A9D7SVE6_9BACT|nr:Gfo/Idh/MocA family oxidoreductase [Candidatus Opimibacter skivensis]
MGMVGGGRGAFIGAIHRMAAALDGQIELVCGAFSSDPDRSKASGADLFLPPERCYGDYEEMILAEANLPADKKMDLVSIVTPNHMHFGPAMVALESGFHVICDKPLCTTLDAARQLQSKVRSSGLVFAVTHAYTGYPMVKQARMMIANGELGKIRRIVVEYPQGWLSTALEQTDQKQASWRTDPAKSGAAGAMGDIGTHAENLAEYVTGLYIDEICADLHSHIPGRLLDDDGSVLLRMNNGARGVLYASQISAGEENNLRIRVYGEKGSIDWSQMEPNSLIVRWLDKSMEVIRTGVGNLYPQTQKHTRVPAGHPEGYLEAFANIYRNVVYTIQARIEGLDVDPDLDFPTVDDGVRGMEFIDAVVRSGKQDEVKWFKMSSQ